MSSLSPLQSGTRIRTIAYDPSPLYGGLKSTLNACRRRGCHTAMQVTQKTCIGETWQAELGRDPLRHWRTKCTQFNTMQSSLPEVLSRTLELGAPRAWICRNSRIQRPSLVFVIRLNLGLRTGSLGAARLSGYSLAR
jgi:hypothetical protein